MGVSIGTVKRIERPGAPPPSIPTLKALDEALGWGEEDTDEAPTLFPTGDKAPTGSIRWRWIHLAGMALSLEEDSLAMILSILESYLEGYSLE